MMIAMSGRVTSNISTLAEAKAALDERVNLEASPPSKALARDAFQLDRMRALMRALGDPQEGLALVHVAGSKGKGSVCCMAAAMLEGCGACVGLYTSPHMVDLRERVQVGGAWIDEAAFVSGVARVLGAARELPASLGQVTHFEAMTALALLHFADQAVDFAVVETGMGGLHDATNVITPRVSAITMIQGEHRETLGQTLEEIAAHKAGIIKKGVPAVMLPQGSESVTEVFRAAAERADAPLTVVGVGNDFSLRYESGGEQRQHYKVNFKGLALALEHVSVPLKGEHQAWNCGLALTIMDELTRQGCALPMPGLTAGLASTRNPGRMELVHADPRIYVDGAHSPESVQATIKALRQHVSYESLWVVFGCAADKDVAGMLAALAGGADRVTFTKAAGNARAADPRMLAKKYAEQVGKPADTQPDVGSGVLWARRNMQRNDVVLVTGSFAVAGEGKRWVAERTRGAPPKPGSRG